MRLAPCVSGPSRWPPSGAPSSGPGQPAGTPASSLPAGHTASEEGTRGQKLLGGGLAARGRLPGSRGDPASTSRSCKTPESGTPALEIKPGIFQVSCFISAFKLRPSQGRGLRPSTSPQGLHPLDPEWPWPHQVPPLRVGVWASRRPAAIVAIEPWPWAGEGHAGPAPPTLWSARVLAGWRGRGS